MTEDDGQNIEMFIEGIRYDLIQKSPVVILRDEEAGRFLPIWIGMPEAAAIQLALDQQTTPRPMTHDLLCNILNDTSHQVTRIVIHSIMDKVFHANLVLTGGNGGEVVVDSRPSDALAVAVRTHAAIFVSPEVMAESAMDKIATGDDPPQQDEDEKEKFKSFLENIKPSDFMDQ